MNHKEAFALMWYGCECGHRERIWNSRDGVTPFITACPSCGESELQHIWWNKDETNPSHKPFHGQRVWIDMTREAAEVRAKAYIEHMRTVHKQVIDASLKDLVDNHFKHGTPPNLRIEGYP